MTLKRLLFCGLFVLGAAATAHAQQNLAGQPGYVDFSNIEQLFDGEPVIEVNVRGALLALAVEATRQDDPELSRILSRLQGVFVRGWDVKDQRLDAIEQHARALGQRLERDGWETVVRVREDGERVHVYLRTDGKVISGMTVMAIDPVDQAVFVNIVGDIDPAEIGRIGRKFGVNRLDEY